MRLLLALLMFLASCSLRYARRDYPATLAETVTAAASCDSLDSKQVGWTVSSIILGGLSGGSGLTAAVLPTDTPRLAMGGISLTLTVFSAISSFMAGHYVQKFCRECANIVPLSK